MYSQDAEVPVIVEDYIDLFDTGTEVLDGISDGERNTCDPEFWDVMKDRAWMEAQREMTQNWNIIARPDSTMALGCFNHYMNKLATYGNDNFPFEPDEAAGQLAEGVFNQVAIIGTRIRFSITMGGANISVDTGNAPFLGYETMLFVSDAVDGNGGDPALTGGIAPYALLELLVLDQLVDGVTACGRLLDTTDFPLAAAACISAGASTASASCFGVDVDDVGYPKAGFLQANFPELALGGRAIEKINTAPAAITDTSAFSEINTEFDSDVLFDVNNLNNCDMMMRVWQRAQCYDFAMESRRYLDPDSVIAGTPPDVDYGAVAEDHDGFYSFQRYYDVADNDEDFRTRAGACAPPHEDSVPDYDLSDSDDIAEIACMVLEHGFPFPDLSSFDTALTTFSAFIPPPDGDSPVWSTAYPGANPVVGVPAPDSDGAPDEFIDYLELRGEGVLSPPTPFCGSPVKTGYLVTNSSGNTYEDAFCTVPGCWFNPPTAVGSNGTCSQ